MSSGVFAYILRAVVQAATATCGGVWHSASKWSWFGVLFLGGVGFLAVGEAAIGLTLVFFSLVSLSSKLWHWHSGTDIARKIAGTVIIAFFFVLSTMSLIAYKEDRPWSNLPVFFNRFVFVSEIPTNRRPLSLAAPTYPPDFGLFPKTTAPIRNSSGQRPSNIQVFNSPDPYVGIADSTIAQWIAQEASALEVLGNQCIKDETAAYQRKNQGLPITIEHLGIEGVQVRFWQKFSTVHIDTIAKLHDSLVYRLGPIATESFSADYKRLVDTIADANRAPQRWSWVLCMDFESESFGPHGFTRSMRDMAQLLVSRRRVPPDGP